MSGGKLRSFDIAIGFPPFGIKPEPAIAERDLFNRFNIPKATWAVLAVQHLLAQSSNRVVVAVPHSLLHGLGSDRALRQQVVDSGRLQAVVSLPSGLVFGSAVQIAVLVFGPARVVKQVRFVDASGDDFRESSSRTRATLVNIDRIVDATSAQQDLPFARTSSCAEIQTNDYVLNAQRYLLVEEQVKLRSKLAGARLVSLRNLVKTVRPLPTTTSSGEAAVLVREVGTPDIPVAGYVKAGRELYVDPASMSKGIDQFLRPGDIVLTIRGSTGKVGIVPGTVPDPGAGGWLAGSSTIVLRMQTGNTVDSNVLFLLLRSSLGQGLLKAITSGTTIPMITLRDLLNLEVPMPPTASSHRVAQILEEEESLQRQIEDLTRRQFAVAGDDRAAGML